MIVGKGLGGWGQRPEEKGSNPLLAFKGRSTADLMVTSALKPSRHAQQIAGVTLILVLSISLSAQARFVYNPRRHRNGQR